MQAVQNIYDNHENYVSNQGLALQHTQAMVQRYQHSITLPSANQSEQTVFSDHELDPHQSPHARSPPNMVIPLQDNVPVHVQSPSVPIIDILLEDNESAHLQSLSNSVTVLSDSNSSNEPIVEEKKEYLYLPNGVSFETHSSTFWHTLESNDSVYLIQVLTSPYSLPGSASRVARISDHKWLRFNSHTSEKKLYLWPKWECNCLPSGQYIEWKAIPDSILDTYAHSIIAEHAGHKVLQWQQNWELAANFSNNAMKKRYFRENGHEDWYVQQQLTSAQMEINLLQETFDPFKIEDISTFLVSADPKWLSNMQGYIVNINGITVTQTVSDADCLVVDSKSVLDYSVETDIYFLSGLFQGLSAISELYVHNLYDTDYILFNPSPQYELTHISKLNRIFTPYTVILDSVSMTDRESVTYLLLAGGATVCTIDNLADNMSDHTQLIIIISADTISEEIGSILQRYTNKIPQPLLVNEKWIWDSVQVVDDEEENTEITETCDLNLYKSNK
ncbi:MAG: hypothetical protein GY928_07250 [Colwellia sp.]|nr:hypothetical protein [Colwellia sp.]